MITENSEPYIGPISKWSILKESTNIEEDREKSLIASNSSSIRINQLSDKSSIKITSNRASGSCIESISSLLDCMEIKEKATLNKD